VVDQAGDEGVSATAGAADEPAADDRGVVLMPGHRGDDRAPSAESLGHEELGEAVDGVLTVQAGDEEVFTAYAPDEGVSVAAGAPDERGSDEEVSVAVGATDEPAADDHNVVLMPGHRDDDGAPGAEILIHAEAGEAVDEVLTQADDEGVSVVAEAPDERASDEEVSVAAGATDEPAADDRGVVLMPRHRGAPQRAKLRLTTYALTVLILAVTGSSFLWQWPQSLSSSEAESATTREEPVTVITFGPSIPDEPRLSALVPVPEKAASGPAPEKAAPEPEPKKAASKPEPKKRARKAPARKPSLSAVASVGVTGQEIEPPGVALATEPASAPLPPAVRTATLVFDVSPWGEIYVDGKLHGTTPPVNTVDLPPGSYRIELRNPTQPHYLSYATLEPGDVRRIRHQFQ
jgi:hypothetical protein